LNETQKIDLTKEEETGSRRAENKKSRAIKMEKK
jgi:hypothetical protein